MQLLGMRMAAEIEPEFVVESGGVDHQRIAFSMSGGFGGGPVGDLALGLAKGEKIPLLPSAQKDHARFRKSLGLQELSRPPRQQ